MSEHNKIPTKSFLDKFQGKTNKIGKTGIHDTLTGTKPSIHLNPNSNLNSNNNNHNFNTTNKSNH